MRGAAKLIILLHIGRNMFSFHMWLGNLNIVCDTNDISAVAKQMS